MASFFGLVQADLENALNVATVRAIYDDGNGIVNTAALMGCLDRAENELISWVVSEYGWTMPPSATSDDLMKYAALDYWIPQATIHAVRVLFAVAPAHPGDITYIITHIIGDRGRVAWIILGNARFYLSYQVCPHVGGLRIDPTAHSREQRDRLGAQ